MPADIFVDTTPMRGGKTTDALKAASKSGSRVLFSIPTVGDPNSETGLLAKFEEYFPRGVAWLGFEKTCPLAQKGGRCQECPANAAKRGEWLRDKGWPQYKAAVSKYSKSVLEAESGWLPKHWPNALKQNLCSADVARNLAPKSDALLITHARWRTLSRINRTELARAVRALTKDRIVIIDEFHKQDLFLEFQPPHIYNSKDRLVESRQLPISVKRWVESVVPEEELGKFEKLARMTLAWVEENQRHASLLYDHAHKTFKEIRELRFQSRNRAPGHILAKGTTLEGKPFMAWQKVIENELMDLNPYRFRENASLPKPGAHHSNNIVAVTHEMLEQRIGELIWEVEPKYKPKSPAVRKHYRIGDEGWRFRIRDADVNHATDQSRTRVSHQYTILNEIRASAKNVSLLSATPPFPPDLVQIVGANSTFQSKSENAPTIKILLERSARSQVTASLASKYDRSDSITNLMVPAAREFDGVLFARSKKEADLLRASGASEEQTRHAWGTHSLGVQSDAKWVGIVGAPWLPGQVYPSAFIDPIGTKSRGGLSQTAIQASQIRSKWSSLQELVQMSARTAFGKRSDENNTTGKCVVFSASPASAEFMLGPELNKMWANSTNSELPRFQILPSQKPLWARVYGIRAFLDNLPLAPVPETFVRRPKPGAAIDDHILTPTDPTEPKSIWIAAFYLTLESVKSGELPPIFKFRDIPERVREKLGGKFRDHLRDAAEKWAPTMPQGALLTIRGEKQQATLEFDSAAFELPSMQISN